MKIRTGFVSNSSSSSFVVGVNPNTEITTEKILETFNVDKDSPIYALVYELADYLADAINGADEYSVKDYLSEYGYEDGDDLPEVIEKISDRDFIIRSFYASDDSDSSFERFLCQNGLEIDTPDLIIFGEGGY